MHARPLAQLDHQRVVERQLTKGTTIGAQRVGQDTGVTAVILGTRDTEPITEAIELLRIGGEDLEAALQKHFHHRSMRRLDRDRDLRWLRFAPLNQPGAELRQAGAIMRHIALGHVPPIGIE